MDSTVRFIQDDGEFHMGDIAQLIELGNQYAIVECSDGKQHTVMAASIDMPEHLDV